MAKAQPSPLLLDPEDDPPTTRIEPKREPIWDKNKNKNEAEATKTVNGQRTKMAEDKNTPALPAATTAPETPTVASETPTDILQELQKPSSWSDKIRFLHANGFTTVSISRILTAMRGKLLRPQHVNNVITRPPKTKNRGRPSSLDPRETELITALETSESRLKVESQIPILPLRKQDESKNGDEDK